eukprot:g7510.t1
MEVTFRVALQVKSEERVVLCGNSNEFGNWQLSNAFELSRTSEDIWTGTTRLKPGEYKFKCVRVGGLIIDWEPGKNRIMRIEKTQCPGSKMEVTMKFAETHSSDTVRTVRETLVLDTDGNALYLVTGQVHKLVHIEAESAMSSEYETHTEAHSESLSESQSEETSPEVSVQTQNEILIKEYFQSVLCFTEEDLRSLFHQYPQLKDKSVDLDVKPIVEFFHDKLEAPYEEIGLFIKKRPSLLEISDLNELSSFVNIFSTDLGVTCSQLMKFFKQGQRKLKFLSERDFKTKIEDLKEITKMNNFRIGKLLIREKDLLSLSTNEFQKRFENLKTQLDLTNDKCSNIVLKYPKILTLLENSISEKVSYLTLEQNRSVEEIVNYSYCLLLSVENRIETRFQQLEGAGLKHIFYNLYEILGLSDAKFDALIQKELETNQNSNRKTVYSTDL